MTEKGGSQSRRESQSQQSQSGGSQTSFTPGSQRELLEKSIRAGRHYESQEQHKETRPFKGLSEDGRHIGGLSSCVVAHQHWVLKVPETLDLKTAPGLLFNGATVYSAIKYGMRIFGGDTRQGIGSEMKPLKVGIVGLGSTGHTATLYAKAMGNEVTILRRSNDLYDYKALGADAELITDNEEMRRQSYETFDLVLMCKFEPDTDLDGYFKLLRRHGSLVLISLGMNQMVFHPLRFVLHAWRLLGVYAASKIDTMEAIQLALEKGIQPKASVYGIGDVETGLRELRSGELYGLTIEIPEGYFEKKY